MHWKPIVAFGIICAVVLSLACNASAEEGGEGLGEALGSGTPTLQVRLAHESSDLEATSQAYGSETDFTASMPLADQLTGLVQAANYNAAPGNNSGVATTADERVY